MFFKHPLIRVILVKIKKILIPLDGSKNSIRALELGIFIARQCGATITGIYSSYQPPHSEFKGKGSVNESQNKEIKQFMEESKYKAAKHGIVFRSKILFGNVGYNIVKMAQNKKDPFDLIIVGSRGRGAVKRLFLGSVSNYVVQASNVPVLVVK